MCTNHTHTHIIYSKFEDRPTIMAQGAGKRGKASHKKNKVHQERKQAQKTKPGARYIAPKRNKVIQHIKTHVKLEKAIKANIESQLASRATAKPFKFIKKAAATTDSVGTGKVVRETIKKLDKQPMDAAQVRVEREVREKEMAIAKEFVIESASESDDDDEWQTGPVADTL
eukprot:m.11552 g.11552  ORF g.11552 m.11552 type:complete len:171 (+) comp5742_c0_seq2:192-704(+)